jgi:hypothetical protein
MISDSVLIFLPLRTLRELRNQPRLRRRLQLIFTASVLTTCSSIVSSAFNLNKYQFAYFLAIELDVRRLLYLSPPSSSLLPPFSLAVMLTTSFPLFADVALDFPLGLQLRHPRQRLAQTLERQTQRNNIFLFR